MTAFAKNLLDAFETLPADEKHQVAIEILRRAGTAGELSEQTLADLAADVFVGYDPEENAGAS
jgi:hypothetical protein